MSVRLRVRLDLAGAVRDADAAFDALNGRAGGRIGDTVAVPGLADAARLAQRLGIEIERAILFADGEVDVDAVVRASPDADGTSLTIAVVRERDAWRAPQHRHSPAPDGVWTWRADASLRVIAVGKGAESHGVVADAVAGDALTTVFELVAGDGGAMPLLDAVARREDFADQSARVRATGAAVRLAGSVRLDRAGGFAGFEGAVQEAVAPAPSADTAGQAPLTGDFHGQLDTALRRSLHRIVANADTINARAEGPLAPHYADYAADIASAARHLLGLVDDLADLEAIEREDFAVATETIDLADVVRRAAGLLSVRAADAGVTLDRGEDGRSVPVSGEFRRTLQILVNLVANAVRYSPRGGSVWLRVEEEGGRAVAIVADAGKGIALADQSRIFDKFERVDPSEAGGSGLGLYIARRLARAMGGDLTVDSAVGLGARFILSLPSARG